MPEGDNPSFWDGFIKFVFFLTVEFIFVFQSKYRSTKQLGCRDIHNIFSYLPTHRSQCWVGKGKQTLFQCRPNRVIIYLFFSYFNTDLYIFFSMFWKFESRSIILFPIGKKLDTQYILNFRVIYDQISNNSSNLKQLFKNKISCCLILFWILVIQILKK
jgi:hypothetical protein